MVFFPFHEDAAWAYADEFDSWPLQFVLYE